MCTSTVSAWKFSHIKFCYLTIAHFTPTMLNQPLMFKAPLKKWVGSGNETWCCSSGHTIFNYIFCFQLSSVLFLLGMMQHSQHLMDKCMWLDTAYFFPMEFSTSCAPAFEHYALVPTHLLILYAKIVQAYAF